MGQPRLYLHVGYDKTGTTSIQRFLWSNRRALLGKGVLVPESGVIGDAHHGLSDLYFHLANRPSRAPVHAARLARELARSSAPVTVISSEFLHATDPGRLAAWFQPKYEVVVILYVRRQDLYVQSAYAERLRMYLALETRLPARVLPKLYPAYRSTLAGFARVFGPGQCRLRPFEGASFEGGSLLGDFCRVTGLPLEGLRVPPALRPSLKPPYLECLRRLNGLPLLEREHTALAEALARLSDGDGRSWPAHFLSAEQRREILRGFQEENRALARDFGADPAAPLFREPEPDEGEPFYPLGQLDAREQQAILEKMEQAARTVIETLLPRARLRDGESPVLPEIPPDGEAFHRFIQRRDGVNLRRRLDILEDRLDRSLVLPRCFAPLLARLRCFTERP